MLTVSYILEIKSCFGLYEYFYTEVTVYSCKLKVPCKSETLTTISCFVVVRVLNKHSENFVLLPVILEDMGSTLQRNMLIAFSMEINQ